MQMYCFTASAFGFYEVVEQLIKSNANIDSANSMGSTSLMLGKRK